MSGIHHRTSTSMKSKPFSKAYEHLSLGDDDHDASDDVTGPLAAAVKDNGLQRVDDDDQEDDTVHSHMLMSIDDAMERLGMGRFQYRILFASGLCFAADAMQVILLSFLTLVLKEEWNLSDSMTASLTSCLFAGSMTGTLILGPLADSMGRRPVFLMAAGIISLFGLGAAMAGNYWIMVAMIFFIGVGIGGLTVPFDILAEFLPSEGRGTNLLLIEYFWTIGCLFVVLVAYLTLHGGANHWRTFIILCSLPCLLSLVGGYLYVPESARWLAAEGRTDEALLILKEAAVANGHDVNFIFPEGTRIEEEKEKESTLADLFTPKWRWIIFRLWGCWAAFAFGYYGTLLAITKVFEEPQTADESQDSSYNFDYGAIFVSSSAELVGTTLVIWFVDRAGRIPSQVVSYAGAGVSVCLLCVLAASGVPRILLIALGFLARVFEMGGTCVTWVSTAEILTTEVRSTGHSTANAMGRIGAFFCPFLVEGSASLPAIGIIMLIVHAFTVICVSKLPETKGKSMGSSGTDEDEDEVDDVEDDALILSDEHLQLDMELS